MQRALEALVNKVKEGDIWEKLAYPTVGRGKTAFPRSPVEQQRLGVRLDYDGVITMDGTEYHKYQVQPNAGADIPSAVKHWRETHRDGTHAVIADVYVKKDGTREDVEEGLNALPEVWKE